MILVQFWNEIDESLDNCFISHFLSDSAISAEPYWIEIILELRMLRVSSTFQSWALHSSSVKLGLLAFKAATLFASSWEIYFGKRIFFKEVELLTSNFFNLYRVYKCKSFIIEPLLFDINNW